MKLHQDSASVEGGTSWMKSVRALRWFLNVLALAVVFFLMITAALYALFRGCGPFGVSLNLSYELWSAPCATTPKQRVFLWIALHRHEIKLEASRFGVDPRAVAGVIGYEALFNFHPWDVWGLTRSEGPGKVHYKEFLFSEGDPAARQVEEDGYLPRRSMDGRRRVLETTDGAITYVSAIEAAMQKALLKSHYRNACEPGTLATFYSAWDPREIAMLSPSRSREAQFNDAGKWVQRNGVSIGKALKEGKRVERSPCS